MGERYAFGPFVLDASTCRLTHDGRDVSLQPKPYELLLLLLRARGAVISRGEVMRCLWPNSTVTEQSLRQACAKLRDTLGPGYIETVRGRGLRFARAPAGEARDSALAPDTAPLPAERDRLVGRQDDLDGIEALLGEPDVRVVQLHGPGGVGKTRLARAVALRQRASWSGGVWLFDLAEATDLDGIVSVIARTWGLSLGGGTVEEGVAAIGTALAARERALVVLDNFEQLVSLAEATVGRWLEAAPACRFLVTTREILPLLTAATWPVRPLEVDLATELFFERARRVRPDFARSSASEPAVRRLVAALDGLPLAIELAAARIRVMGIEQIAERLAAPNAGRSPLLGKPDIAPARHVSLRATLEWSWQLLSPIERAALAQCSVFEGGFSLDAAEAVLDLSSFPGAPETVDLLQALVEKSLVCVAAGTDAPHRFELLQSVRAFVAEPLGADTVAAYARHGAFYASDGQDARDLANVIAATRRAVDRRDAEVAVWALAESVRLLWSSGPIGTAVALARAVCALPCLAHGQRYQATDNLGVALMAFGRSEEAVSCFEEARAIARRLGERDWEIRAGNHLGIALEKLGRLVDAARIHEEALRAARSSDSEHPSEGMILNNMGVTLQSLGRLSEAREAHEVALACSRRTADRHSEANALCNLGFVLYELDERDRARACFQASLELHREQDNRISEGRLQTNLGALLCDEGRLDEAQATLLLASDLFRRAAHPHSECLVLLARVHRARGALTEARACAESARDLGTPMDEADALAVLGHVAADEGVLDEARWNLERAAAVAADREQLLVSLEIDVLLGLVDARSGATAAGLRTIERATRALRQIGARRLERLAAVALAEGLARAGDQASATVALGALGGCVGAFALDLERIRALG